MAARAPEIHQGEIELLGVLMHPGAPPDDLLELGHGADCAVQHDEPAGLRVDAGGKQPGCSDQHWISGFRVDEVTELLLPLAVVAGDAHDVAVVRTHQIGVLVNEPLAHPGSVLLIDAEENGLLKAVPAFLQELRDFPGYELGSAIQNQRAVEVLGVIDPVPRPPLPPGPTGPFQDGTPPRRGRYGP